MYQHINDATIKNEMIVRLDSGALLDRSAWAQQGGRYDPNTKATATFSSCPAGQLWARVYAQDGWSDSFFVTASRQPLYAWHFGGPTAGYQWRSIKWLSGDGSVEFGLRELNAKINCIAVLPIGQTPTDADALIAFGQPPPPPPPPKKEWPYERLGLGVTVDPGWPGWENINKALKINWFYDWQVKQPWPGFDEDMVTDSRFIPTAFGRSDEIYLHQLQDEFAFLNDGIRPVFVGNEPELGGPGQRSPSSMAHYLKRITAFWKGPVYGVATLTRPQSRTYLRQVISAYGPGWDDDITGVTCHVYTNVDHHSGSVFVTGQAISDSIRELRAFIGEFPGKEIVVNEYGGLTYNTTIQAQIQEYEKVNLFERLYADISVIPEVTALCPFSSFFAPFPTGNHLNSDGSLTPVGALFNKLVG